MNAPSVPPINDVLRGHVETVDGWEFSEIAKELHRWGDIFNLEFELRIETPALQIERLRPSRLGQYRRRHNGLGLLHEVTMNRAHAARPLGEQLETFLHELLHLWQEIRGKPSGWNYHNEEFREKARTYGLIVTGKGHHVRVVDGPFTRLLARYGVDYQRDHEPDVTAESPTTPKVRVEGKMKKWTCGCTNFWAAVQVNARCLKCANDFARAYAQTQEIDVSATRLA